VNRTPHALLTVILATGVPAVAKTATADPIERAQRHVDAGESAFRRRDYAASAEAFLEAETALVRGKRDVPPILYRSVARSYELLGRETEALNYYERFLKEVDPADERLAPVIGEARSARVRISGRIKRTSVTLQVQPTYASVRLDGEPVWETQGGPVPVSPGPHRVALSAPGHLDAEVELDVPAGSRLPIIVWLRPAGAAGAGGGTVGPSGPLGEALGWMRGEGQPWALGGLGLLSAGAVTGAALLYGNANDLRGSADDLAARAYHPDEVAAVRQQVHDDYSSAAVFDSVGTGLVVTALAAAAGAAWLWLDARDEPGQQLAAEPDTSLEDTLPADATLAAEVAP